MTATPEIPVAPGAARCLGVLDMRAVAQPLTDDDLRGALDRAMWEGGAAGSVFDRVRPGENTCVVVSDHTRQTAADRILPVLVEGLCGRGCRLQDISILIASGIHRRSRPEEIRKILGSRIAAEFEGRIHLHDPDDASMLAPVGVTPRGHEVGINRRAVEARRLILIGGVGYHYHAGFTGGRKSLVPGLAARATIAYNHSLTLDPEEDRIRSGVGVGRLDGNAVAEEMLAAARLRPPDFIVNSVLAPDGGIAGVFAGDMNRAHRAACRLAGTLYRVELSETADFVVAFTESLNWIQSHKALFNASRAVHEAGGRIVLAAPCREGIGDDRFRHWVTQPSVEAIYRGLREAPEVLGQTALSTRLRGERTVLVTEMPAKDAADLGIETAPDLESAIVRTLRHLGPATGRLPTYYVMPHAHHTVPFGLEPLTP